MGGKSSNNLREETFILLMVSKVQSMASISELKMGQQKQQEGSGCSLYGGQKTEGITTGRGRARHSPRGMLPRTPLPLPGSTFESGHPPRLFSSAMDQCALGHAPWDLALSGDTDSSTLRPVPY